MKFSEAIRLGAMMKPQAFGKTFDGEGRTCAVGAAYDAIGKLTAPGFAIDQLNEVFPIIATLHKKSCPVCSTDDFGWWVIPHLNDEHKWTREQIAEWVEMIERAQEQPQAAEISTPVSVGR